MVTHLSMLTAVLDGRDAALRAFIESLPVGEDSPFASVPGTHNGRWTVVRTDPLPPPNLRSGGLPRPMLMCSAVIDPEPGEWVGSLLVVLGPTADAIWGHCAGWPGVAHDGAGWLLRHRVKPWLSFATWDAPVADMRLALRTRDLVERLAVDTQGADAHAIVAAYRAALLDARTTMTGTGR
jgi:hypothetical protein